MNYIPVHRSEQQVLNEIQTSNSHVRSVCQGNVAHVMICLRCSDESHTETKT